MSKATVREVSFADHIASGDDAFTSHGYAYVKVTRGAEIVSVKIRVVSVPHEWLEKLRGQAPKPPVITVMGDPKNPEHSALGITQRQKVMLPNFADAEYVQKMNEHQERVTREVVGHGIDETLKFEGESADSPEKKYRALQALGISAQQFAEIANAIMSLTDWTEEEREGFLTRHSA